MKKQIDKKMTFSIETNLQLEDEEEIDMKIKYKISFAEELSKKAFNPSRISKYLNEFNYDLSSDSTFDKGWAKAKKGFVKGVRARGEAPEGGNSPVF